MTDITLLARVSSMADKMLKTCLGCRQPLEITESDPLAYMCPECIAKDLAYNVEPQACTACGQLDEHCICAYNEQVQSEHQRATDRWFERMELTGRTNPRSFGYTFTRS